MVVMPGQLPNRVVDDVETLKALSDPVRIAILRVLMDGADDPPKVLSVKEIAEQLGEPQTKLYRHIKVLQARDLIRVAETRMVSGILEHRYQTAQRSLDLDATFFSPGSFGTNETVGLITAVLDDFRNEIAGAIRTGQVRFDGDHPPAESYRKAVSSNAGATVPAAKASEFRDRLAALVQDIVNAEHDPDGVPIRCLAMFYSPKSSHHPNENHDGDAV